MRHCQHQWKVWVPEDGEPDQPANKNSFVLEKKKVQYNGNRLFDEDVSRALM